MNVTSPDQNEAGVLRNGSFEDDDRQQEEEEVNINLIPRTLPQDIINNQAVSDPAFYALSVFYCIVICGSVLGNLLVITAVLRSAHMRKVNNILIVNLAVSDLLLCTLVSPMTLMEILYKRWPGPHLQVLCILSGMVPVCITFVSTLTITGIAIDRYKVIVYSATSRTPPKLSKALCSLLFIWSVSILLSCPLIFAMSLEVIHMPKQFVHIVKVSSLAYCAEEWGQYKKGRLVYSIFSLVVQFILPLTLISFAHSSIKKKLQKLPSWQKGVQQSTRHRKTSFNVLNASTAGPVTEVGLGENETLLVVPASSQPVSNENEKGSSSSKVRLSMMGIKRGSLKGPSGQSNGHGSPTEQMDEMTRIQNTRLQEKIKKQARTHSLLVSIVIVFALSWFPLNMLNIILDIHNIFQTEELSRICFALCHLIGMSSAFSNPILYGWFNEAFKEEFQSIAG